MLRASPWRWKTLQAKQLAAPQQVRSEERMMDIVSFELRRRGRPRLFGRGTEAVVKAFQADHGLTPDGMVGSSQTWPALITTQP